MNTLFKLRFPTLVAVILLGIQSCFTVSNTKGFEYRKVKNTEYAQMLRDSAGFYLIDVRTAGEYRKAHVPGAWNFSFLDFHFARDVDSLDRNKAVFVYCQTCHRSPFAAKVLKKSGFHRVYDLRGGFQTWTGQVRSDEMK